MSIEDIAELALEVIGLLAVAAGVAVLAGWAIGEAGGPAWSGLAVGGLVVLAGAWWASRLAHGQRRERGR